LLAVIRVAEVSGVQDIDIALVDDFVGWVEEEVEPILGLIEYLWEKDEIGTIGSGGLNVYASKFDVFGVGPDGLSSYVLYGGEGGSGQ
jgi:hypothetical protein